MSESRLLKRSRLEVEDGSSAANLRAKRAAFLSSLARPVSPPGKSTASTEGVSPPGDSITRTSHTQIYKTDLLKEARNAPQASRRSTQVLPSPFRLTRVRDLPAQDNGNTIGLGDVLGDPLIKEAWIFNFCFDIDWTMQHFDQDVRQLVNVKIVHGSWKREDRNRIGIEDDMKKWRNVQEIRAYLPDPFGTHHSKMIILLKHDDTAQVVIHTANMLAKDWEHMTQAAWLSPVLPLVKTPDSSNSGRGPLGSGSNFKADLLRYVKAYGNKLKPLCDQLQAFDFSQVRAALIASTPSKAAVSDPESKVWGHLSLRKTLQSLKSLRGHQSSSSSTPSEPHLICQISSIATLPQTYLQDTIYKASGTTVPSSTSIIYPTPSDLQNSVTGYATGGSIHTKISTAANQKQVSLLRPQLHRWGAQSANTATRAGRHMIPPHIKTYIKFTSKPTQETSTPDISWALLTSANLSQQAWGTIPKSDKTKNSHDPGDAIVHIQSYEIGVLVWPELFADTDTDTDAHTDANADPGFDTDKCDIANHQNLDGAKVRMVPVFGKDTPESVNRLGSNSEENEILVGLRMPYDLPLVPYGANEMPWSPNERYTQPDRLGRVWTS